MGTLFSSYSLLIPYIISNLAGVSVMLACFKRPIIARVCLAILFGGAGCFNAITALKTPLIYVDFANHALLDSYRWFILGPFPPIAVWFILAIAVGQLLIAGSMVFTGWLYQLGCMGGIIFSLAILPLGIGSAAPSTFFLAIGFYRLYKYPVLKKTI